MRAKTVYLLLFSLLLWTTGCHNKHRNDSVTDENFDYPVGLITDTISTSISDEETLYTMEELLLENFLRQSNQYQGQKVTMRTPLPEEWGVLMVERLPEGRELMLVQSKNREWKYLLVTSGFGTQRILDLMPVAVNLANQNGDVLETEKWSTYRQPDGAFRIIKNYDWTHSVTGATRQQVLENPEKYHRQHTYTEQYIINDMGHFEAVEIDTLPDYKAVVFFYNINEKPEMWDEYMEMLESYCEENNILYEEVYQEYNRVILHNYDMSFSIEVDITPYTESLTQGLVLMGHGLEPKTIPFGNFEFMQMVINRYFHLDTPTVTHSTL
ncbi:MAG: hypothetical protein IKU03_10025 [Bacteroidales bacterium]|nr:hypothetical protein [Bacteroidales bacterium]